MSELEKLGLSATWRQAAHDAADEFWKTNEATEEHHYPDAIAAADAAVRVVLEHLRNDGGAWLTTEGAAEIDHQHERLIAELTGWSPMSSIYRFEAAIADAFDKLADERVPVGRSEARQIVTDLLDFVDDLLLKVPNWPGLHSANVEYMQLVKRAREVGFLERLEASE
jgi:hypothetical protein